MSDRNQAEIDDLLAQGLDHYGVDDVGNAILSWERVLEIDPENAEAADYIKTADRRSNPRPKKKSAGAAVPLFASVLEDASALLREGRFAEAYDMVSVCEHPSGGVDVAFESIVDLTRSRLYGELRDKIGTFDGVPKVTADESAIRSFNLPPNAGFLLSMVDGETSVADLISVSGMDAFDVLYTLGSLMTADVVEFTS